MKKITSILFVVLITELALGGGGRLVAFGPISLRMILFALALLVSIIHFVRGHKIPRDYLILLIAFFSVSALALVTGILSDAPRIYWWEDIKPLMYFLILPFFHYAVTDNETIDRTSDVFKLAGVLLSICFFSLLILIHVDLIHFSDFYPLVISTEEFFFRGEITFTYKGFLFLCVGFIFIHFAGGRYKYWLMGLVLIAIAATITRGFWFALLATYSVYYFKESKIKSVAFALLAIAVIAAGQIVISKTSETIDTIKSSNATAPDFDPRSNLLGDRSYSDEGRLQQIKEVIQQTTFSSALIGHGFGNGTPSRLVHMEIAYLEIFHKQGFLGLAFWAFLFWNLFKRYRDAQRSGLRDAFFYSSLFVFIQSLTNQYVNNPIGLSVVLLSIVCLDHLKASDLDSGRVY